MKMTIGKGTGLFNWVPQDFKLPGQPGYIEQAIKQTTNPLTWNLMGAGALSGLVLSGPAVAITSFGPSAAAAGAVKTAAAAGAGSTLTAGAALGAATSIAATAGKIFVLSQYIKYLPLLIIAYALFKSVK